MVSDRAEIAEAEATGGRRVERREAGDDIGDGVTLTRGESRP
jgi:hypothetical protein